MQDPVSYNGEAKGVSAKSYEALTPKMAWQLAAAHTWPASIIPVLIAAGAAYAHTGTLSASLTIVLLIICVLMQSSVNTFNDYYDYVKGTDSQNDNVEASDSVLVYNNVNPRSALLLAVSFLIIAFLLGIYAIIHAGLIPLAIGLVGALIVVLYSAGKTPISYLPIGEAVSGLVMGGLIPLACYQVLTLELNGLMLVWAIPVIIGIALIMMTNNTCDIEKDIEAGRKTLPVTLGRSRSLSAYHALLVIWVISIVAITLIWFSGAAIILPFTVLASYPLIFGIWKNPLLPQTRIGAMGQICSLNVALGGFYALSLFASSGISITL